MSYYEAIEDKIPFVETSDRTIYYPPCHICGESVKSFNYLRNIKYTCKQCRELMFINSKEIKLNHTFEKRNKMLNRALHRISNVANINNYNKAIEHVKSNINESVWFQSTEEVMVALQLYRKGIEFISQFKIGPYFCDFYLPNFNFVIEVDGDLFHGKDKAGYDAIRDEFITNKLGANSKVLRIKTSLINLNVTRITNALYKFKKMTVV